jgi:natural product precursor
MKKLVSKLKLNQINKSEMEERQLNILKGGNSSESCSCGCGGPYSTSTNSYANYTYGGDTNWYS